MTDKWVLTWARIAFIPIFNRKDIPQPRELMAFDSQEEAIDFAMSLDDPQRQTAQLQLPGGDIAELLVIQQMYATQK